MSGSSRWFLFFLYAMTALFILGVCWLFLSNLGYTGIRSVSGLMHGEWFFRSFKLSLATSCVTTLIAMLLGIPAAYALSRFDIPGKKFIDVVFSSIIVLPASTIGLCLMVAFQYEPILKIQESLGFRVVHSVYSIIIAQLVLALAFGIKTWRAAFDAINPRFEQIARTLGSSRIRTFRNVTLPLARMGIFAGVVLAWTRAMAEFGSVLLFSSTFRMRDESRFPALVRWLGLDRADILPVGMWIEIEGGNIEQGIAIGFVLLLITAVSVYALNKISGKEWVRRT